MGKDKDKKEPSKGAFTRMNYLYQAAHLVSKSSSNSPLSNYYAKVMKEISKKIVEKLHPDLKRSICTACNYPLTAVSNQIKVKVQPHKRRKRKCRKKVKYDQIQKIPENSVINENVHPCEKYKKCRLEARHKKPNKIKWTCCKCGFTKVFLQRPYYEVWTIKNNENECLSA